MTIRESADEAAREREGHPFGKPRPYTPDHPDLLAEGLPRPRLDNMPVFAPVLRTIVLCLATLLAGYALYGLITDDLYLPGRRSAATRFHGVGAWCMAGMLVSVAAYLVTAAFSRIDSVRLRSMNKRAMDVLLVCAIVFMVAGVALGVTHR